MSYSKPLVSSFQVTVSAILLQQQEEVPNSTGTAHTGQPERMRLKFTLQPAPFSGGRTGDNWLVRRAITTTQCLIVTNFIFNDIVGYFMAKQSSFDILFCILKKLPSSSFIQNIFPIVIKLPDDKL